MKRVLAMLLIGAGFAGAARAAPDSPPTTKAAAPQAPQGVVVAQQADHGRSLLVPSAGFGWATESGVAGPTPHVRVGLSLELPFTRWLSAQATVRDHFYRREYLLDRLELSGRELARVRVEEQKLDAEAFALFHILSGPRLRLSLGAGPAFRFFLNEALPSNFGALAVVGRADLAISTSVDLSAGATWGYNLFFANAGLGSALGPPRAVTGYRAGLTFHFAPDLRFTVGYEGEALALAHSYRLYHSVTFLLEVPLGKAPDTAAGVSAAPTVTTAAVTITAPRRGQLVGRVLDAASKKPLADAIITLPGRSRLLASASGTFSATDLDPGPLTVRAELPGFAPAEARAEVAGDKELSVELLLKQLPRAAAVPPLVGPATLKGSVISQSGMPLAATVAVPSSGLEPKRFPGGDYEFTLPAGAQVLEASAPGYLTQARRLNTQPGETLVTDFVLAPAPAPKKTLIIVRKDRIEIKQQVHFAVAKAVILPDSDQLLDQVAAAILENAQLERLRIEGHTDSQGNDAQNLALSARRAEAVMQALVERGVDSGRLKAVGFGETKPIASNTSEKGRQKNRRVEFMIEAAP